MRRQYIEIIYKFLITIIKDTFGETQVPERDFFESDELRDGIKSKLDVAIPLFDLEPLDDQDV